MYWIESVLDYSKSELKLIGFDKSELGDIMLETIKKIHESVGNKPMLIKTIIRMMSDLEIGRAHV